MRSLDLSTAVWRKSSYSNTDGGECVEVADQFPGLVPVRDSKVSDGPALVFGAVSWASFVAGVRGGEGLSVTG
ncbi:hypothetical protein GCM10010329_41580 [Streptomyces spiroverticillatus]|uniref:DUF397 domain-containing protein n=1 Tax=Streptomyces finlayi TaxID=67296 RepID=A0A918WZ51_9ACTN|nr:DUF397 domain-containing protein [Streptomyces finlayi]GHA14367.1 hypothetical protein GCM10010329_41580 [Streptomyces spiroverticillatus]GHC97367.1 hypothetical protein GCM10010334_38660 [Streptomyces finlayi]